MTLDELINKYQHEEIEVFKYRNSEGQQINTVFIFESQADYMEKYLGYYKTMPNLTEAIVFATDGTFKLTKNGIDFFIRHNHQEVFKDKDGNIRGVSKDISKLVWTNLIKRINNIMNAVNFEEIMNIVTECKVKGFGELAIYDTSLRISKFRSIEPDKVYLHAGARKGFEVLESKGYINEGTSKKKSLNRDELPEEFIKNLKPHEIENLACLYKLYFEYLENKKLKAE